MRKYIFPYVYNKPTGKLRICTFVVTVCYLESLVSVLAIYQASRLELFSVAGPFDLCPTWPQGYNTFHAKLS